MWEMWGVGVRGGGYRAEWEDMRTGEEGRCLLPPVCVYALVHSGIPSCNYNKVENDGKKRMRGCWRLQGYVFSQ